MDSDNYPGTLYALVMVAHKRFPYGVHINNTKCTPSKGSVLRGLVCLHNTCYAVNTALHCTQRITLVGFIFSFPSNKVIPRGVIH